MIAIVRNSIEKTKLNRFFILMKFTLYKTTLSTSKLIRQGENFTYKQQMMLRLFVNLGGFLKANSSVAGFTRQIEAIITEGGKIPDFKMWVTCTSYAFTSLHPPSPPNI